MQTAVARVLVPALFSKVLAADILFFAQTLLLTGWDSLERMYYAVDAAVRRSLHDSMHTLVTVKTFNLPCMLKCATKIVEFLSCRTW